MLVINRLLWLLWLNSILLVIILILLTDTSKGSADTEYVSSGYIIVKEIKVVGDEVSESTSPPLSMEQVIKQFILNYKPDLGESIAEEYAEIIVHASSVYEEDPLWVTAMVAQESGFRSDVVSRSNAIGLMQILPSTAKPYEVGRDDLFDPQVNITLGVRYLHDLQKQYGLDLKMATIAYNQGITNVKKGNYNVKYYHLVKGYYDAIVDFAYELSNQEALEF